MIRNQYNRIPHAALNIKQERNTNNKTECNKNSTSGNPRGKIFLWKPEMRTLTGPEVLVLTRPVNYQGASRERDIEAFQVTI